MNTRKPSSPCGSGKRIMKTGNQGPTLCLQRPGEGQCGAGFSACDIVLTCGNGTLEPECHVSEAAEISPISLLSLNLRMNTFLVILAGVVLFAIYVLVWMNRASPTVIGAALPAAITLLSAIVLVFLLNRPAPISRVFPVIFIVEKSSGLPVVVPDRPFPFKA